MRPAYLFSFLFIGTEYTMQHIDDTYNKDFGRTNILMANSLDSVSSLNLRQNNRLFTVVNIPIRFGVWFLLDSKASKSYHRSSTHLTMKCNKIKIEKFLTIRKKNTILFRITGRL